RHTHLEGEITIGSGNSVVVGKYVWGGSHIGYNRMNFRWGNVGTFQSSPGSHMWQILTEHYKDDQPIPLTVCFGLPVASTLLPGRGLDYAAPPSGRSSIRWACTCTTATTSTRRCARPRSTSSAIASSPASSTT